MKLEYVSPECCRPMIITTGRKGFEEILIIGMSSPPIDLPMLSIRNIYLATKFLLETETHLRYFADSICIWSRCFYISVYVYGIV